MTKFWISVFAFLTRHEKLNLNSNCEHPPGPSDEGVYDTNQDQSNLFMARTDLVWRGWVVVCVGRRDYRKKLIFLGIKQSTSVLRSGANSKNLFFAEISCFFRFIRLVRLKMTISTSVWNAQHPNPGQIIQHRLLRQTLSLHKKKKKKLHILKLFLSIRVWKI